jgi:CRP-like cAMP-binding protein
MPGARGTRCAARGLAVTHAAPFPPPGRPVIEPLLAKLGCYDRIGETEARALAGLIDSEARLERGTIFVRAGERLERSTLLLDGFVVRYKDLLDGRRQTLELSVPGDFVDLHSFTLKRIDHDIACLTPCRLAYAPHARIAELTARFPHLTRVLWLSTSIDAAIHRERIVSLGARTAVERLAHLCCETYLRLRGVGLAEDDAFAFPLTQGDVAELLGLSMVHTNRTVRELRERGLARVGRGAVRIDDWDGLRRLGQFDAGYLGQHREPR